MSLGACRKLAVAAAILCLVVVAGMSAPAARSSQCGLLATIRYFSDATYTKQVGYRNILCQGGFITFGQVTIYTQTLQGTGCHSNPPCF